MPQASSFSPPPTPVAAEALNARMQQLHVIDTASDGASAADSSNDTSAVVPQTVDEACQRRIRSCTAAETRPLPPPPDPRLAKRTKLASELLSSEMTYVSSLDTLCKVFVKPLCQRGGLPTAVEELFRNVQVILGLNRKFLHELHLRMQSWNYQQKVGDVFLHFSPFMKMYTSYAQQHDSFTRAMLEIRSKGDGIFRAISSCEQDPRCKGNGLESFVILPIQRIPRYRMLFASMVELTPQDHPDHQNIKESLQQSSMVASQVNEAVREREMNNKIIALQKRFVGDVVLVAPSRRLIRSGQLSKVCRAKNQTYEFLLFNDLLVYARPVTGMGHMMKLHRSMAIDSSFEVHDIPSSENDVFAFQIRSASKSFEVHAKSQEDKIEWLLSMVECIQGHKMRLKGLANSSDIIQAPIWQPDKQSSMCQMCNAPFRMMRRRHHCRHCGLLVCSDCSKGRYVLPGTNGLAVRVCRSCAAAVCPSDDSRSATTCRLDATTESETKSASCDDDEENYEERWRVMTQRTHAQLSVELRSSLSETSSCSSSEAAKSARTLSACGSSLCTPPDNADGDLDQARSGASNCCAAKCTSESVCCECGGSWPPTLGQASRCRLCCHRQAKQRCSSDFSADLGSSTHSNEA